MKKMRGRDYCAHCRRVKNVIKDVDEMLCKSCGKTSKITKLNTFNFDLDKTVHHKRHGFGGVFG